MGIHNSLEKIDINIVHSIMRNPVKGESVEYNDNRISLYVAQNGKCAVSNRMLSIEEVHCHHIIPRCMGGKDNYKNLIIIDKEIHKLIHATTEEIILSYLRKLKLDNSKRPLRPSEAEQFLRNTEKHIEQAVIY